MNIIGPKMEPSNEALKNKTATILSKGAPTILIEFR
jgi:hypothetical protein